MRTLAIASVVLVAVAASSVQVAEAHPHRTPQFHRGGFTIGLGFGGGLVANDVPLSGAGWLGFRIGGVVNYRLGILFDHELMLFGLPTTTGDVLGVAGNAAIAFQIYLDPAPLWLKLGGGLGYLGGEGVDTNLGGAIQAGLGIELLRVRHRRVPWALSLETQVIPLFLRASGNNPFELVIAWTIGLGFQWY